MHNHNCESVGGSNLTTVYNSVFLSQFIIQSFCVDTDLRIKYLSVRNSNEKFIVYESYATE